MSRHHNDEEYPRDGQYYDAQEYYDRKYTESHDQDDGRVENEHVDPEPRAKRPKPEPATPKTRSARHAESGSGSGSGFDSGFDSGSSHRVLVDRTLAQGTSSSPQTTSPESVCTAATFGTDYPWTGDEDTAWGSTLAPLWPPLGTDARSVSARSQRTVRQLGRDGDAHDDAHDDDANRLDADSVVCQPDRLASIRRTGGPLPYHDAPPHAHDSDNWSVSSSEPSQMSAFSDTTRDRLMADALGSTDGLPMHAQSYPAAMDEDLDLDLDEAVAVAEPRSPVYDYSALAADGYQLYGHSWYLNGVVCFYNDDYGFVRHVGTTKRLLVAYDSAGQRVYNW